MTAIILKKLGYEAYLRSEFEYGVGKIKKRNHEDFVGPEKYYGFNLFNNGKKTHYINFVDLMRVKGKEEWRRTPNPQKIRGQMGWLFVSNPVVYLGTVIYRLAQLARIISEVFVGTFCEVYPQKKTENLSKVYLKELTVCLQEKKEETQKLWEEVKRDFHFAMIMQLATCHALLNGEDAIKMEVLFSDKEKEWNHNRPFKETSSFGASRWIEGSFKASSPYLWLLLIHRIREEATFTSEKLKQLMSEEKENPIEWLENTAAKTKGGLIRQEELEVLGELLNKEPYAKMSSEELYKSKGLKRDFLWTIRRGFAAEGFVQYHCAYPFSEEKQKRIEVLPGTVMSSFEKTQQAFKDLFPNPSSPVK